jgi:hypothetical protein
VVLVRWSGVGSSLTMLRNATTPSALVWAPSVLLTLGVGVEPTLEVGAVALVRVVEVLPELVADCSQRAAARARGGAGARRR